MKIALIGNPNSGKTTLFNALTGNRGKVGNWAGVTVEKKQGDFTYNNKLIQVIDLPGIYSLSPYSEEEVIARNFLLMDKPDLIINIVDVTNFERNLYLTTQLMEIGIPIVLAINMMDLLSSYGGKIDIKTFEKRIDIPCIPISASKSKGLSKLIQACVNVKKTKGTTVLTHNSTHTYIREIFNILKENNATFTIFDATKILEEDEEILKKLPQEIKVKILHLVSSYKDIEAVESFDIIIADQRYKFIEILLTDIMIKGNDKNNVTLSDEIDKIVTHKYLGIPLFFLVMFCMFMLTFNSIGGFLLQSMEHLVTLINILTKNFLLKLGASPFVISLVVDGIISGVGMVLTFLPQILLLFLFLTILEDVGYMSRAAFIMDNFLRKIGLSGKAFVPMLMGFGCTVPAIMATRTLENKRDRTMAIILTPFMSCGARLPVYVVFTSALFVSNKALVIFSLYLLGIIVAIISGFILKETVLKGDNATFIMELPPYRLPIFNNVLLNLWDKTKGFVQRAGTVLLTASVIIWFLQSFDLSFKMVTDNSQSIFGTIGTFIAPIFIPLGFGTWEVSVSLLAGFVAKEAVVSTLGILYSTNLSSSITTHFTQLSAYSYMVFVLLYMPCIVAFATIKKELNSWKWTLFTVGFQTLMAYIVSFLIYQIGLIFLL